MSDMDTVADLAGVDIEAVVSEVPGVMPGMKEGGEEVKVHELLAALASKPLVWPRALREGSGECRSGPGG
jgi:hypothetical protein